MPDQSSSTAFARSHANGCDPHCGGAVPMILRLKIAARMLLILVVLLLVFFAGSALAQQGTSSSAEADGSNERPVQSDPAPEHASASNHALLPEGRTRAEMRVAEVAQVVRGILGYARWPQTTQQGVLQLCVAAPTEYADALMGGSSRAGVYRLSVRRVLAEEIATDAYGACDAVYIGIMEPDSRADLLKNLVGKPVLTISESSQQCNDGSLFCLRVTDSHVAFDVNLDSVARSGIRINPQVLRLARPVGASDS